MEVKDTRKATVYHRHGSAFLLSTHENTEKSFYMKDTPY